MKIEHLNWEWAMDTIDLLRQSVEAATAAHDEADVTCHPIEGEPKMRISIRRSLQSVQRNLADATISIRGILSDQEQINALHRKFAEDNPISESDIPF